MELTLASAFSTGGLVGHAAYVLLVGSMLMRNMVWLRILVIASALVGIVYSIVWLQDPVSSFWETLLVTVNVVQLAITRWQNSTAKFSAEERAFATQRLRGLTPYEQKSLLRLGSWEAFAQGAILTHEGEYPVDLHYIASGAADVRVGDDVVATCGPGTYVGEMSLIADRPASARVEVTQAVRAWVIHRTALEKLEEKHPSWVSVIEAGIARDLRDKLLQTNRMA